MPHRAAVAALALLVLLAGCQDDGTPRTRHGQADEVGEGEPTGDATGGMTEATTREAGEGMGAGTEPPACATGRSLVDQPDETDLHQLHVLYVVPSDGADRGYDTDGSLARSMQAANDWLAGETGGARLRVDACGGQPDVTFVRLARSDADVRASHEYVRDVVQEELVALGFDDPGKLYVTWYDGSSDWSCGGGAWPPDLVGHVAAMYLLGEPPGYLPCDDNAPPGSPAAPTYFDFGMLHEILHTLGFVPACAPHEHHGGHSDEDPRDLMYQGPQPWDPQFLDVGRDDYFQAGIPDCPGLESSVFLDPMPEGALEPPGWP